MKFEKVLTFGIAESKLDKEYWKRLGSMTEKVVHIPRDSPDIKNQIADTDCLLVNFGVVVDKDLMDAAPKLKYIGVLATAYGKVDVSYAETKGIAVCNIPNYSTESVAEFVFAAILEHLRQLEKGKNQVREGDYSGAGFSTIEIKNRKFGVLGLGNIGSRVAEIALGFGADVRYWSRNRKPKLETKGIKYEDVNKLISQCDFLSLNFAQTQDTSKFLNESRIRTIKKDAVIINTAPMELVDIKALEKRLHSEDITFILDHSDEMNPEDVKRLLQYKNCVVYPPIAYMSQEALIAKQEIFVGNIENFLRGSPTNKVGV